MKKPEKIRQIGVHVFPCGDRTTRWEFLCGCGKVFISTNKLVASGQTQSCGCVNHEKTRSNKRTKNYSGVRFGRLVALERIRLETRGVRYKCLCDCGNELYVSTGRLTSGNTKSCGCFNIDKIIERNKDPDLIMKRTCTGRRSFRIEHFRSKQALRCNGAFEANVVDFLNKHQIDFDWQIGFKLSNNTTYLCDLYLIKEDTYVEIKGRWYHDAVDKFNLFLSDYPNLKVEVWDMPKLKQMGIPIIRKEENLDEIDK
jgi:hypothetical protein